MTTRLLQSKLCVPPVRPELVSRPRLVAQLDGGLGRKLTLVSAPAGFGKTTLLSVWLSRLRGGQDASGTADRGPPNGGVGGLEIRTRAAWVSLDEGDNDPARFWTYLFAALDTLHSSVSKGARALLQAPQPPPMEAVLTTLLNDITTVLREVKLENLPNVLVLDDYHVIETASIHRGMTFLIEHLPSQISLVVSSRAVPPFPLARLRARGQLTELGIDDLRFTPDEAGLFLSEVMALDLSAGDVAVLETRTEGWIAGLQLAALSVRGQDKAHRAHFIQAFSGSHRYVLDYLSQEVLDRQPQDVRRFLLQTSILRRLTGALCDALTERDDGQRVLEGLESSDLFLVPLDDERRWYRYHQLFAEQLQASLQSAEPGQIPELHRRAAAWYEKEGLLSDAVGHALAGGDLATAARMIEQSAAEMLWMRGEVTTLLDWLAALPDKVVRRRPGLSLAHAWALFLNAEWDAAGARVQDAQEALKNAALPEQISQNISDQIAVMEAMLANFRGEIARTIELSRRALEFVPERNLLLRASLAGNLGGAYVASGDLAAAVEAFTEAKRLYQATGNTFVTLLAASYEANLQLDLGQLHEAHRNLQDALQLAAEGKAQPSVGARLARVWLARLLYEWDRLDEAARHVELGLEDVRAPAVLGLGPGQQLLVDGYLVLAQVRQAQGDVDAAFDLLHQAEKAAREYAPAQVGQVMAARVRLSLGRGDLEPALRWKQTSGLSADDEPDHAREFEYLTLVRVLLAQARLEEAWGLSRRLQASAENGHRLGNLIEAVLLQAVALLGQGLMDEAQVTLEQALLLAEPQGYLRLFVDAGAPAASLLAAFRSERSPVGQEYVDRLQVAFGLPGGLRARAPSFYPHSPALVEPLSERELEVLHLIVQGLTNREIAEELVVAVTTVKKHASNIYGKLGVHSRTQAVARARDLGLVQ